MQRKLFQRVLLSSILLPTLLLASFPPTAVLGANVDFNSFSVGTILTNQFAGVTFLKYKGMVNGIVVDSPSGKVASFTQCDCEFPVPGANMVFSTLQRTVTMHVGLLPHPTLTVQRDVRLTAFDATGAVRTIATANMTSGAGFETILTVTAATPEIATVVLEAIDDPTGVALIAIRDITLEDDPGGRGDFSLELPPGTTVLQDGGGIDVPLTIHRFAPSTGTINFSVSEPPAGVSASIIPNPALGNGVMLHLQATSGPAPEIKTLIVTGSPSVASAGPAPRSTSIDVTVESKLRVNGPADIDFAGCAPNVAHGTVTRDYWVIRDYRVTGPIKVELQNLPADVTGSVTPQTLDFPGWAIGQRVRVTLTTIAGPTVPDAWIPLNFTGPGVNLSFPILIHGSCPRQNHNFVIRGQVRYANAVSVEPGFRPLRGVQVEIFRYRSDWYDDRVGEAFTDEHGNYSVDLYASTEGEFYPRVRLFSPAVQLEDFDNGSVWSIDSARKSNRGGLITTSVDISRDRGAGTPRAAVWQGFYDAAHEFRCTVGQPVPGGSFIVEVWRGSGPLAFYDEVHWNHGSPTGERECPTCTPPRPANPYRITTHEFAHVFRDVLDGDEVHWHADNTSYVYTRYHDSCQIQCGTTPNAGFAFHEGWAEYWSRDIICCPNDVSNESIEGTVASDLDRLANLAPVIARDIPPPMGCPIPRTGRRGMVQILQRGSNLIHSETEFRREYESEFPAAAPLPIIGDGGCPVGPGNDCIPLTRLIPTKETVPQFAIGLFLGFAVQADSNLKSQRHAPDPVPKRKDMVGAIDAREKSIAALTDQQRSSTGLRSFALRAAVEEGILVAQRQRDELAEFDRGGPPERYLQRAPLERHLRNEFVGQRKAIQIRALRDALARAPPELRPEIDRRLLLLKESRIDDASLESMIPLPPLAGDDMIALVAPPQTRWFLWIALAITLLIVVLLITLFRSKRA